MFEELFSRQGLSLERLRTLCEIAAAAGVTRAAKDPVRQSQYSRQLRDLEVFFGADLFVRKRNQFRPTEAGEKLLRVAKEFLAALEATGHEIRGLPQTICVGAGESIFHWLLFPRFSEFQRLLPNMTAQFRNLQSNDIVRLLLESELDLGIVRHDACPASLKRVTLGNMSYCLFVPKKLFRHSQRSEADLVAGLPLAILEGEGQYKTRLVELAKRNSIELNLRAVCSSFPLMTELVKQEEVAAILPNIAEVELSSSDFARVKLNFLKPMERRYVLAYREKTMARRESLARHLPALGTILQIETSC